MTRETHEKVMSEERKAVDLEEILTDVKKAIASRRKMTQASEARYHLPAGSRRARVTTANARHATACEAYDRQLEALKETMSRAIDCGILYYKYGVLTARTS